MKKLLLVIGLMFSTLIAHAGPLEELSAAFQAEQEKNANRVQPMATSQSVLRTYLATQSGFTAVTSGNTNFGYFIPRATSQSVLTSIGFQMVSTQTPLDILVGRTGSAYAGYMILVYYDIAGNASEIYLTNTQLP